jgi:hypothetical protein
MSYNDAEHSAEGDEMTILADRTHTVKRDRPARQRSALRGLALAGIVGLLLFAVACGGRSQHAKVAQIGTRSTATNPGPSNTSGSGDLTAYSACMRAYGVRNFPDPDSKGRIAMTSGVDPDSFEFKTAARKCQQLLPNGGRPTLQQQRMVKQAALKFARCMRAHGVPSFPDPTASGALAIGKKAGVDPNSPRFKAAQQSCKALAPGNPSSAPSP